MINYIVARKKNMTDGSIKYYAKVAPVSPVYVNDIAARISKTCTVTEHDVKAVLSALQEQVIYSLSDGHSVRLGDLGSFRPTLSVYTFDTPEEVTAAGIKHVRTRFTPGTRLVAAMRTGVGSGLTFGKVSAGNGQDMPADETE